MHLRILLEWAIVGLLIILLAGCSTKADDTPESIVDAQFTITLDSATDLYIEVTLDVSQITVFGELYEKSDIQAASTGDLETMGAIKLRLRQLLEEQLEETFIDATVTALSQKPTYENNRFYDEFGVTLSSTFFGMSDDVDGYDIINGVLDMGAEVMYEVTLHAETGWDNTYTLELSSSMYPPFTNGEKNVNTIRWTLQNEGGMGSSKAAKFSLQYKAPTTPTMNTEDIRLAFVVDSSNAKHIDLIGNIVANHIEIRDYDVLPPSISDLDFVTADGLRLFIENGLTSWQEVYQKTMVNITRKITSVIENSSFNQTLDTKFQWKDETTDNCSQPYNVTHMDDSPSIQAELIADDINLQLCDIPGRAFFGLIYTGGTANISANDMNFGDGLTAIGYPYNATLRLPQGLYLDGKNSYVWNQTAGLSGQFNSSKAPGYTEEQIETTIEIEISTTDLNLLGVFTGKTELSLGLFIEEKKNYHVSSIPDSFSLPEKLSIQYLVSDAFRLCVNEGVFDEESISAFLAKDKQLFQQKFVTLLPNLTVDGHINRNAFDESLQWDEDIGSMSSVSPVTVVSYAHSSYPLSFNLSMIPPSFEIKNQNLNLRGLQNQDVTYRIIFPHGTNVTCTDELGKVVKAQLDDGRNYIEVSFDSSESALTNNINCKIIPSALFVIGIFMPCIVSFAITLLLIVVIYIIRKKRKGGKTKGAVVADEERYDDGYGYEDEDYYVPPPPSTK